MHTVYRRHNYQVWCGNTSGGGLFLGISHPNGAGPALPNFWGSLLFMHTPCRRTTKSDVVTHVRMGVYWVSHVSRRKAVEMKGSPILRVLLYLCPHPLTQNDQIQHGNMWGRVFCHELLFELLLLLLLLLLVSAPDGSRQNISWNFSRPGSPSF